MLYTLVCILVVLWLLGFSVGHLGGILHFLIVIALVLFILQMIGGRTPRV